MRLFVDCFYVICWDYNKIHNQLGTELWTKKTIINTSVSLNARTTLITVLKAITPYSLGKSSTRNMSSFKNWDGDIFPLFGWFIINLLTNTAQWKFKEANNPIQSQHSTSCRFFQKSENMKTTKTGLPFWKPCKINTHN